MGASSSSSSSSSSHVPNYGSHGTKVLPPTFSARPPPSRNQIDNLLLPPARRLPFCFACHNLNGDDGDDDHGEEGSGSEEDVEINAPANKVSEEQDVNSKHHNDTHETSHTKDDVRVRPTPGCVCGGRQRRDRSVSWPPLPNNRTSTRTSTKKATPKSSATDTFHRQQRRRRRQDQHCLAHAVSRMMDQDNIIYYNGTGYYREYPNDQPNQRYYHSNPQLGDGDGDADADSVYSHDDRPSDMGRRRNNNVYQSRFGKGGGGDDGSDDGGDDDCYSNYSRDSADSDYSTLSAMFDEISKRDRKKRCWQRRRLCHSPWFFPWRRSHDGLQTITHVMTAITLLLIVISIVSNIVIAKSHTIFHSHLTFNWMVTIIVGNGVLVLLSIICGGISSMLWWKTSACYHYTFLGDFDEYETLYDHSREFMRREFDTIWTAGRDISSTTKNAPDDVRDDDDDIDEHMHDHVDRVTTFTQVPPSDAVGYFTDTQTSAVGLLSDGDLEGGGYGLIGGGGDGGGDTEATVAAVRSAEVERLFVEGRRRAIRAWRANYEKLLINFEMKAQLHRQWASTQRYPFMMCCMITNADPDGMYE